MLYLRTILQHGDYTTSWKLGRKDLPKFLMRQVILEAMTAMEN
ncbi:hypothetical protein LINPERPRIM_LOCUS13111 [Linum perenne]